MKKQHIADALLLFATIIWGSSFFITKSILNDHIPAFTIMMYRGLITSLLVTPLFFKSIMKVKFQWLHMKYGIILGFYIFMGFAFQTIGQVDTTPSKNAFLTTLNVIFVPIILFLFYKKKLDKFNVIAAIMAVAGTFILTGVSSGIGSKKEWLGDILTIISAIFWALQIIKTSQFAKKVDMWVIIFFEFLTMSVLSLVAMFIFKQTFIVSQTSFIGIFYLASFCSVICFGLMTIGLKYTSPERASLIFTFEGVFGTIFSIIVGSEPFLWNILSGGCIIFLALVVSETKLKFIFNEI